MIFVVSGNSEIGPVLVTCETAAAALDRARLLSREGVRDLLIDAGGQEYAPADFERRFMEGAPLLPALPDPEGS